MFINLKGRGSFTNGMIINKWRILKLRRKLNKRIIRRFVVMMVMSSIFATLTACSSKEGTSKKEDAVRMAYFPNITHAQALVMKQQGVLEKELGEGVNVTWTSFNAGPAEIEAIFAGEIDIGYIGPVPAVSANVKSNGNVSVIAGATNGGAVLVTRKDVTIHSVKELDGLKVAIPQLGNTQHLALLHLLSENQMKPVSEGGKVNVIAASNADIKVMLDNGEVDAALVPEPWGSILEHDIQANLILDYKDIWRNGDYATAVVVVNNEFAKEHPDIVNSFLKVHKDTTIYINENLDEAKTLVNQEIQSVTGKDFDKNILNQSFDRLIVSDEIPRDSILDFANLSKEEGFIEEVPSIESLIYQKK